MEVQGRHFRLASRSSPPPPATPSSAPHLSLLLRAFTSRPMASLLSVASSSSRCSFLRLALMRWDSSSASSSCLFSCLTLAFPFSACQGEDSGSARLYAWGPKAPGEARTVRKGRSSGYLLLVLFCHLAFIFHLQQDLLQLLVLLLQ